MTETSRLAPSPTGSLHLGNARTFLWNWALARARGWRLLMRVEDLDGPRVRPGASEAALETLRWLGVDWDGEPLVQSRDLSPYRAAMERLAAEGRAFPCELSRTQVAAAASAPQDGSGETPYPASLRPASWERRFEEAGRNWRFLVPDGAVRFADRLKGDVRAEPAASIGDFIVWTKAGGPAYQLAVVVDDHAQGVTQVVRGDDLLDSAARQLLLYRALGLSPEPAHWHLPLVVGADGRRLAKRHGDSRLETFRAAGVPPERIVGLAAWWSGLLPKREPLSTRELLSIFDPSKLPSERPVFGPEDERWLTAKAPATKGPGP